MAVSMGSYSPKLREEEEARIMKIKLNTPLVQGYTPNGVLTDGMEMGQTYEFEVEQYLQNIPPESAEDIRWEYAYSSDDGGVTIGTFKRGWFSQNIGEKVEFEINSTDYLGKELTFYAFIKGQKQYAAQLSVYVHYRYRMLNWTEVESQAKDRMQNPWKVDQASTSLCGMASIFYLLVKNNPEGYMKLVTDLHHYGEAEYNGYTVKPHYLAENTMYAMDPASNIYPSGMPSVDWLTLATLRSSESTLYGLALYSGKRENDTLDIIPAINWPRMMIPLCKKFLGYEHVNAVGLNEVLIQQKKRPIGGKLYDKLFDTDLDHLEDMDLAHKKGHEVIMMIDSKMFDGETSYSYADIFNDTHWIVYEGGLEFIDSNGYEVSKRKEASHLRFKIFTWGEDPKTSIRTDELEIKSVKSTFYGYIECYNDYKISEEDKINQAIMQSQYKGIENSFPRF